MIDAKHTLGPWIAGDHVVTSISGANLIATIKFGKFKGPDEAKANTLLIAASPDLLEHGVAAIDGMAEAIRILDLMERGQTARDLQFYRNNLSVAVRKATGVA